MPGDESCRSPLTDWLNEEQISFFISLFRQTLTPVFIDFWTKINRMKVFPKVMNSLSFTLQHQIVNSETYHRIKIENRIMEKKSSPSGWQTGNWWPYFYLYGIMLLGRNLDLFPMIYFVSLYPSWYFWLFEHYSILRRQMFTGLILFVVGLCFVCLVWVVALWIPVNAGAVL